MQRARSGKSQRKRRGGARLRWATLPYPIRLVISSGGAVLSAWVLFLFVVKVFYPYRLGWQVESEIKSLNSSLYVQNAENARLRKELARLQSLDGMEENARRAGFARKGESVFFIGPKDSIRSIKVPSDTAQSQGVTERGN